MSAVLDYVDLDLRPIDINDIDAIMAIERRVYTYPWTERIFLDCLQAGYCGWKFEQLGEVVAYAMMSVGAGDAHLLNLCVKPEMQRQGVGRRMLSYLFTLARGHEARNIFLEVRPSNRSAIALYSRMGFNEVGTRNGYYVAANGREDALIFAYRLRLHGVE